MRFWIFFFLLLAGAFLLPGVFATAQEEPEEEEPLCESEPPDPSASWNNSWTEYRCEEANVCEAGGDNDILSRGASEDCWQTYEPVTDENGCVTGWTLVDSGCSAVSYGSPGTDLDCGTYQVCSGSTDWNRSRPSCECSGQCYPAPTLNALDHEDLSPANVFEDGDSARPVKLPFVAGWEDDVQQALNEENPNADGSSCTVNSYRYAFSNGGSPVSRVVRTADLEDPTKPHSEPAQYQCEITPGRTNSWSVEACSDTSGNNCGEAGAAYASGEPAEFTVSTAPELKTPYDSDWEEEELAGNAPPVLTWCSAGGAESYVLEVYEKEGEELELLLPERIISPSTSYDDDIGLQEMKSDVSYWWQVAQCPGQETPKEECSPFSQLWGLIVGGELGTPANLSPQDGAAVNFSTSLAWQGTRFAEGYLLNIWGPGLNEEFPLTDRTARLRLGDIWEEYLELDTLYSWKVASCTGGDPELNCVNEDTGKIEWSETKTFRTTGARPAEILLSPTNETGEVGVPVMVEWYSGEPGEGVPGAASYVIEVPAIQLSRTVSGPASTLYFSYKPLHIPQVYYLNQGETYEVSVTTCADEKGEVCGGAATTQFAVATLGPPLITEPQPAQVAFIPSFSFRWEEVFGANAYEYRVRYAAADPEETAECKSLVGPFAGEVVPAASDTVSVRCQGEYELQVRGCMESTCLDSEGWGEWSESLIVSVQEPPEQAGGLVPCGRAGNNPDTPWDERKSCGIEHLFLLVRNLVDFILFRIAPLLIAVFAGITGVLWYTAAGRGATDPLAETKQAWKAIGIGLLIVFLSWTFLNILLGLLGFSVGVFGNWYEVAL